MVTLLVCFELRHTVQHDRNSSVVTTTTTMIERTNISRECLQMLGSEIMRIFYIIDYFS
jgi:hypothetical protein